MNKTRHECNLTSIESDGLPKLSPNIKWFKKLSRDFWKLIVINPSHFMCNRLFRNRSSMLAEKKRHAKSRYFFVIHPLSTLYSIVEVYFFFMWMYGLICESMLMMDFRNLHATFERVHFNFVIPSRIILVALLFNAGYIDHETKEIVFETPRIVRRYLLTYFFFDFMTTYWLFITIQTLMYYNVLVGPDLLLFRCEEGSEILCLSSCCVRIYTLLEFMENTLTTLGCGKTMKFVLLRIVKTFFYLHILTCLVFYVPYLIYAIDFPPESWLSQAELDEYDDFFRLYFECFLVASSYFFGISERHSITLLSERICMAFITFFGRLYTLFLLADVLNTLGIAGVSESKYERQMAMLRQYMTAKALPDNLRRMMIKYFKFKYQGRFFKESHIIDSLSDTLRTELFLFTANKLIRKVEVFRKLPSTTLGAIIATMKSEIFSPKDVIVKCDSQLSEIYFISSGTVAVTNKNGVELCHLEDGEEFGASSLIIHKQIFTVVAVETTEVFFLDKHVFLDFLDPHPLVKSEFYRSIREKLATLQALESVAVADKFNFMSELRKGNILEKLVKRPRVAKN